MTVLKQSAVCYICCILFSVGDTVMDEGNDFVFVFPEVNHRTGTNITVYVYQKQKMMNTITGSSFKLGTESDETFYITHVKITEVSSSIVTGTGISNKCTRYTMDGNFKIYVEMPSPGDFYMAMPVSSLAISFYAVTYCETPGSPCQIQIIAISDYTNVEIYLTAALNDVSVQYSEDWYSNGDTIQVVLAALQVVQLQSDSDLTGTHITSNSSISVFSGSSGTTIQGTTQAMVVEQMPPVHQWGMEHITVPTPERTSTGDYFRMVTCSRNTIITISGESPIIISEPGHWIQRNFSGNNPRLIRSDKPILIVRLTVSERFIAEPGGPTMVVMVPNEQFVSGLQLDMPKAGTDKNFVTVVTKYRNIMSMRSHGGPIGSTVWKQVANSTYWIAEVSTLMDNSEIMSTDTDADFVAYVYGRTGGRSNAYVGGRAYAVLNPACVPSVMEFGDDTDNDCDGEVDEDICTLTGDNTGKDCAHIYSGQRDIFGMEFLIVFPHFTGTTEFQKCSVMLSTIQDGNVEVKITTPLLSTPIHEQTITFQKNTGKQIVFLSELIITANGLSNNTVLMTSDKNISAYVTSLGQSKVVNGAAYRLISVDVLGKHYFVVTVCENNDCQVVVTAAYSNTVVRLFLKLHNTSGVVHYNGANYTHGDTIKINLLRYQSVQISGKEDMTGTEIVSNKPVAVFSGGQHTSLRGSTNFDQVIEQLIPVYALDVDYVITQAPGVRSKENRHDRIMIISTEDDTTVKIETTYNSSYQVIDIIMKLSGTACEYDLMHDTVITGTKAVMVVHLLKSCPSKCGSAIMVVPPISQLKSYDTLFTFSADTIYLSVFTEKRSQGSVKYDQAAVGAWQDLENDVKMSQVSLMVNSGVHLINTNYNETIGGYVTTQTSDQSATLAFPLAFNLNKVNEPCMINLVGVADGFDNDCDGLVDEENCTDTSSRDDDLDGMFDEDCMNSPLTSSIQSSSIVSQSPILSTSSDVSIQSSSVFNSSSVVTTSNDISIQPTSVSGVSPSSTESSSSDVNTSSTVFTSSNVGMQSTLVTTSAAVLSSLAVLSSSYVSSKDVSESLQPSMSTVTDTTETCMCFCTSSMGSESLAEVVESIQRELYVDKATVSKTIRKYISIPDSRPSATGIGYLGIGLISGLFVSILILDAGTLIRDFKQLVSTLRAAMAGDMS